MLCLLNSSKSIQYRETKFGEKIGDVENKIPGISGLASLAVLNTKIADADNEIPDLSGLANNALLHTKIGKIKSKIPGVSKLVRNTD